MAKNIFIDKHKASFDKSLDFLKRDMAAIRTGRANASIVEEVMVEAYGAMQPIKNLANLSVPESSSIAIQPWDKSIMKDIEIALTKANLGLGIVNTGDRVIAKVPMLTEETRKEMVKLLGNKVEEARISVRKIRDEVKDEITTAEKNKEMTEDDKYQYLDELDNFVQEMNKKIEEMREEKEAELMKV